MGWKEEAMSGLRERGAVKALVHFSGGNDEGGVDGIDLIDAEGGRIEHSIPDWEGAGATTADIEMCKALGTPVYEEYGGFSGEFSVDGTVTFDLEANTVTMSRDVQYYQSADDRGLSW